jgi:hypothetical protein
MRAGQLGPAHAGRHGERRRGHAGRRDEGGLAATGRLAAAGELDCLYMTADELTLNLQPTAESAQIVYSAAISSRSGLADF